MRGDLHWFFYRRFSLKNPMKQKMLISRRTARRGSLFTVWMLLLGCGSLHAATLIDLSKPVSESIPTPTGVYWTGNSITTGSPNETTPDGSPNGYNGILLVGNGSYSQTTGVNRTGTSGYGNGIRLATTATAPGTLGNPKIQVNLPAGNQLDMVATDFTGGVWVNFHSLLSGAQTVNLMNRGPWTPSSIGHWGLNLFKDASGNWQMAFQVGNGSTAATVQINVPVAMTIATGVWHHFGFSYDYNAAADNVVTFWMDGVNLGTQALNVNIAADTGSTKRFTIGERTTTGYSSVFDGTVDDVFVTTGLYEFQAIPEPGTYALLLFGAGVLLLIRRQRVCRS